MQGFPSAFGIHPLRSVSKARLSAVCGRRAGTLSHAPCKPLKRLDLNFYYAEGSCVSVLQALYYPKQFNCLSSLIKMYQLHGQRNKSLCQAFFRKRSSLIKMYPLHEQRIKSLCQAFFRKRSSLIKMYPLHEQRIKSLCQAFFRKRSSLIKVYPLHERQTKKSRLYNRTVMICY